VNQREQISSSSKTEQVFIHLIPPQDAKNMQPISGKKGLEELLAF